MSNPVVEIIGNRGVYDGHGYKVEVVGEIIRIEYKLENLEGEEDLLKCFKNSTHIAKQIKAIINS